MRESGQTTLEFVIGAMALLMTLSGAAAVLRTEWQRAKCAYLVFEHTHARLSGSIVSSTTDPQTRISELPDQVIGDRQCGNSGELVSLKKLESIRWN